MCQNCYPAGMMIWLKNERIHTYIDNASAFAFVPKDNVTFNENSQMIMTFSFLKLFFLLCQLVELSRISRKFCSSIETNQCFHHKIRIKGWNYAEYLHSILPNISLQNNIEAKRTSTKWTSVPQGIRNHQKWTQLNWHITSLAKQIIRLVGRGYKFYKYIFIRKEHTRHRQAGFLINFLLWVSHPSKFACQWSL